MKLSNKIGQAERKLYMENRYSVLYKRKIHGNDCCPFWCSKCGGTCISVPYALINEFKDPRVDCTANEDERRCRLFQHR